MRAHAPKREIELVDSFERVSLSPLNGAKAMQRDRLLLVGASLTPRMCEELAPLLDDPAYDVWGCNSLWNLHLDRAGRFRADAWFEMHPLAAQTPQERRDMDDCPVPIYVLDAPLQPHWTT